MKRVEWTEAASRDLREAENYLNQFHPALGRDLVTRALEAGRFILAHPAIGSPMGKARWRKWPVKRTRYLLLYRPTSDGIETGRLRHNRSNWKLTPD